MEEEKKIKKNIDDIIGLIYSEFVFKDCDWTLVNWVEILWMLFHCKEIHINEDKLKGLVFDLCNDTITFFYLLGLPGYSWDIPSNVVTCNSELWNRISLDVKPPKKFKKKGLSRFDDLLTLFIRTNYHGGSNADDAKALKQKLNAFLSGDGGPSFMQDCTVDPNIFLLQHGNAIDTKVQELRQKNDLVCELNMQRFCERFNSDHVMLGVQNSMDGGPSFMQDCNVDPNIFLLQHGDAIGKKVQELRQKNNYFCKLNMHRFYERFNSDHVMLGVWNDMDDSQKFTFLKGFKMRA